VAAEEVSPMSDVLMRQQGRKCQPGKVV
jgi:hypothetical protein